MTRPSAAAKETLIPPERLLVAPPLSDGVKDPDKESSSNRPLFNMVQCQQKIITEYRIIVFSEIEDSQVSV
jgi:hypothetical protein